MTEVHDVAIIGGGVNGCGVARDAAGRGLTVFLCEADDLASGASSASTKLIHGGLRYLEYYEFRLVREALLERERLWRLAPHIVRPMRFVLPHHGGLRPRWLLRLGLFIYDHLGGRKLLPATRTLDLTQDAAGAPLRRGMFETGFEYSDCWVDDSRLVALNARDAADRGAVIKTRMRAVAAMREASHWILTVEDQRDRSSHQIRARALVNAAGPWVGDVLTSKLGFAARAKVRLVQGSHIIVPKLFDHDRSYMFQNADGRIVFAIPYEADFTLIGTTDVDYLGDPAAVRATEVEIRYLCDAANSYFKQPVQPADVVWSYAGVRPLYDDGSSHAKAVTRDYVIELDEEAGAAPLLSIFGGKITTYRRLAELVLDRLSRWLPTHARTRAGWTATAPLPGGEFPVGGAQNLANSLRSSHPFLSPQHALRLVRAYGLRASVILGDARRPEDLGRDFGATLTEAEVRYLRDWEWAVAAEDILWRRSKLGLHMTRAEADALAAWMKETGEPASRASDARRCAL